MLTKPHQPSISPYWLAPHMTIFIASACIMIMELVAGRIIARHVGMSLYTWTAIIGIIMAGISLGNHLGGRMADRYSPRRLLAPLFLCAALGCALILPLNTVVGAIPLFWGLSWPLRIFLHVTLVFLAPATALGMITPVVAKMALDYKREAGRTLGGIFAFGVGGSLVGTFAAGYYLVMLWGAASIVLFSALGLAVLGVVYLVSLVVAPPRSIESAPANSGCPTPMPSGATSAHLWAPAAATVFMSNAAFMIFELAAMRVIAREFGSSLYTWTMIIGIVLAGISLGNYLGGRIADRSTTSRTISFVFALSALLVLLSPTGNSLVSAQRIDNFHLANLSWPAQIGFQVFAMCFIPCIAIGMVSPIVTRRLLSLGRAPGASVGIVYAWGSIGAIFGTFLAGYWLLQWMGAFPVVAIVALLLALVALAYGPRRAWNWALTVCCAAAFLASLAFVSALNPLGQMLNLVVPPNPHAVYEDESQYSYIAILEDPADPNIREMLLDQLIHTRIDMRDPTRLLYEYEWVYSAVMMKQHPRPQPVRAFIIGGGGYAYPHYLEKSRPGSNILVSEIDPAVTEAAHAALGLPRDTSMRIEDRDARNVVDDLLRRMENDPGFQRFDYIFGDSINDYTVPYHLTTVEFKQNLHTLLTDNGVYLFNMIDMLDSGAFLAAVVNTCRQVFPQVAVYNTGRQSFIRDTFIVVCARTPMFLDDIPLRLRADYDYTGERVGEGVLDALIARHRGIILTDDYAPVENLLAPVVRTRAGDTGELNLSFARRHAARGEVERALQRCRAALAVHPRWPEAYELLAQLLEEKGDVDGTIDALTKAIDGHQDPATAWFNLGRALMRAERHAEAADAWRNCVRIKPDHVAGLYNLGLVYGVQGDLPNAIASWRQALEHNPAHEDSLHNLSAAYIMRGDIESARAVVDTMQSLEIDVSADILEYLKQHAAPGGTTP